MFINPKDYDPKKLTGDEAQIYQGWACAREAVDTAFWQVIDDCYDERFPKLNDLLREVIESTHGQISEIMGTSEVEFVCSLMESHPEKYVLDPENELREPTEDPLKSHHLEPVQTTPTD